MEQLAQLFVKSICLFVSYLFYCCFHFFYYYYYSSIDNKYSYTFRYVTIFTYLYWTIHIIFFLFRKIKWFTNTQCGIFDNYFTVIQYAKKWWMSYGLFLNLKFWNVFSSVPDFSSFAKTSKFDFSNFHVKLHFSNLKFITSFQFFEFLFAHISP